MIQTSYFAQIKALREGGVIDRCVPICRHMPRWLAGEVRLRRYARLAPPADLLGALKEGWASWEKFAAAYRREVLGALDVDEVLGELAEIAPEGAILMCYCKGEGGRCHRHLVAAWLGERVEVREWEPPSPQASLF